MKPLTETQKKLITDKITEIGNSIVGNQFFKSNTLNQKEDYKFKDFGFDELDFVELVMECEKIFNVCIPDDKVYGIKKLHQLYELIENQL